MSLKGVRILIVDDEPAIREILSEGLSYFGAHVLSAAGGNEALALLKLNTIDVVVSDVRMPSGDGYELLRQLHLNFPIPPKVVMMTGYSDLTESEVVKLGAQKLLLKPFSSADLKNTIEGFFKPQ